MSHQEQRSPARAGAPWRNDSIVVGFLLLGACSLTVDLGRQQGEPTGTDDETGPSRASTSSGGTSAASDATAAGMGMSGGSTSVGTAPVSEGDGASTTGEGTTSAGASTSGGETTGPSDICEVPPGGVECFGCAQQACCAQLESCQADMSCMCFLDCIQGDQPPQDCQALCNPSVEVGSVLACLSMACPMACAPMPS